MSSVEPLALGSDLSDAVRTKLQNATGPVTLAVLVKPKPRQMTAAEYADAIRAILDEQVRLGSMYSYPSGKNGTDRYWHRDEKHLLRSKAIEIAAAPLPLSQMTKMLSKEVKGVDKRFLEMVVRELASDGHLFEYPPKKAKGAIQFCASPPPPPQSPLEQAKHKRSYGKLLDAARKLLEATKLSSDELIRRLHDDLTHSSGHEDRVTPKLIPMAQKEPLAPTTSAVSEIEALILKELDDTFAVSIADVRATMPAEYCGPLFDETILRLADEQRISVHEDAEPSSFSDAERAVYVQDGTHLYTSITKRG